MPLGGNSFTWSNKWGTKLSKLDRFLLTEGLCDLFPGLTASVLGKGIPDHSPILFCEHRLDYGSTWFRIFHFWFLLAGFDEVVMESWNT